MNPSSSSNGGGSRYYNIGNTLELFLSLGYGMMGWYLPRHFMFLAWPSIVQKDISEVYQLVGGSNGNNQLVVVDFLLNHPLVDPPTVPTSVLTPTTVYFPLVVTLLLTWRLWDKDVALRAACLRTTVCAWATAIGTSEGLTQILKLYVQRRRPNFIALCEFTYTFGKGGHCTADDMDILEANLSFPSGHSSLAACGMTFLTLAVLSQLLSNNCTLLLPRPVRRWSCALVALGAFCYTLFVGTSRIVDNWHHPSDVLAGWLLGSLSSVGTFQFWFPPIWHSSAGVPWTVMMGKDSLVSVSSSGNLLLPRTSVVSTKGPSFHE